MLNKAVKSLITARVEDAATHSCVTTTCRSQGTQSTVSTTQRETQCSIPVYSAGTQTSGASSGLGAAAAFLHSGACCERCGRFFAPQGTAENHWQREPLREPQQNYDSPYCPYSHHIQELAYEHETTQHSEERPYSCRLCSRCLTLGHELTSRERLCVSRKPYTCQVCQRCFKYRHYLTRHELLHMVDKPYVCKVCYKCFEQRSSLTGHQRIHSDETPHACDVCPRRFIKKSNLTAHERVHVSGKPYACKVCQRCFKYKFNLASHERRHRSEESTSVCNV